MIGDYISPTGKLIQGSVKDCNKKTLERLLKDYDRQLYIKWNPDKKGGWGCWEIRRKPEFLTHVPQGKFGGYTISTAEYVENDLIHHVLDLDYLSYSVLGKLKSMDTWKNPNWASDLEYNEAIRRDKIEKDNRAELVYNLKQHKREWRDFAELVSQGVNPGKVLSGKWGLRK